MTRQDINPQTLVAPRGYQNGVKTTGGHLVFIAGQIGCNKEGHIVSAHFAAQFEQALWNFLEVVKEAGGGPEHVTQMTIFVTDKLAYLAQLKEVGQAWKKLANRSYPAMALVEVRALVLDEAQVEIQGMAVVP